MYISMRFCPNCQMMLFVKLSSEDGNGLSYYCRNCGHESGQEGMESACVLTTNLSGSKSQYGNVINRYTKMDPTLPRTNMIKCPSQECPSNNQQAKREVIYLRYDDVRMKYMYLCAHCDEAWKTGEQS